MLVLQSINYRRYHYRYCYRYQAASCVCLHVVVKMQAAWEVGVGFWYETGHEGMPLHSALVHVHIGISHE